MEGQKPSDAQLSYARNLGIRIDAAMDMQDVSDLIDAAKGGGATTDEYRAWASAFGVVARRHEGKRRLFQRVVSVLSEPGRDADLMAWFAFRVLNGAQRDAGVGDLLRDPHDDRLKAVGRDLASDPAVVRSVRKQVNEGEYFVWFGSWKSGDGETHQGASTRTKAYLAARQALQCAGLWPEPTVRAREAPRDVSKVDSEPYVILGPRWRVLVTVSIVAGVLAVLLL